MGSGDEKRDDFEDMLDSLTAKMQPAAAATDPFVKTLVPVFKTPHIQQPDKYFASPRPVPLAVAALSVDTAELATVYDDKSVSTGSGAKRNRNEKKRSVKKEREESEESEDEVGGKKKREGGDEL
ncbi:hypothetical protein HK096_007212 [Nowakowskiella sp. JEL0078]|nr:hypothetical protein HK096_007212 [Nowakowskiella sp. JEL0078]